MATNIEEKPQNNHHPVGANIPEQIIPQNNMLEQKNTQEITPQQQHIKTNQNEENSKINQLNSTTFKENNSKQNKNSPNFFNTINGFNPMTHVPPKYDIYGYLKPIDKRREDMSILAHRDEIKIPWNDKNSNA